MNRKVSNAEELLELIRSTVKSVHCSINEAISNLKEAKAYAEDIDDVYANDLYNLAERNKEEREINATSLDIVWENFDASVLVKHLNLYKDKLAKAGNIRIRFYEILDKEEGDEQN